MGARYYDPQIGRFTSPDSINPGATAIAWNRYAYANNNPILYTDPTGHINCRGAGLPDGGCSPQQTPGYSPPGSGGSGGGGGGGGDDLGVELPSILVTLLNGLIGSPLPLPAPFTDEPELWQQHIDFCRQNPNFVGCGPPINGTDSLIAKILNFGPEIVMGAVEPFGTLFDGFSCGGGEGTGCLGVVLPFIGGGALRAIPALGPAGNAGAFTSAITITKKGVAHTLARHFPGGAKTAGKSVFNSGEWIPDLVTYAQRVAPATAGNTNLVRIVDAHRTVGIDVTTGNPTNLYTVVTTASGDLVTIHPGVP